MKQARLDSLRIIEVEKAKLFRRHRQEDYELIFVQQGCYRCVINGSILRLRPHDVLVVARGDWHEEFLEARLRYLVLHFNFHGHGNVLAHGAIFGPGVSPEQQVMRGPNQEAWRIVEWLQTDSEPREQAAATIENALLHRLLRWLVRTLTPDRVSPLLLQQPTLRDFGDRLRVLFDHHLSENLANAEIAAKLGMSERNLTKRCREAFGRPPGGAFKYRKMEYAAYVLRHPGVSVKRVSILLGFRNQFHFSRVFRRHHGHPPSHHRYWQR